MAQKKKPNAPKQDFKRIGQVLADLLEAPETSGVPPEFREALLAMATPRRRSQAALPLILALGVEARSPESPRPILESLQRWIIWAGAAKGLTTQRAGLLIEALASGHIESGLGQKAIALFSIVSKGRLGDVAWAGVQEYRLEGVLAETLRRLGDPKVTTVFRSRLSKHFRELRKATKVRADPAPMAEILVALELGRDLPLQPPTWFSELLLVKDIPWLGQLLAEIDRLGGADWREKVITWLAPGGSVGAALHFVRASSRSGRPPTESDLRELLGSWPSERSALILGDLIRECAREPHPALLLSLAQVVKKPATPFDQEQTASLVKEIQRACAGPYQPHERDAIIGVLVEDEAARTLIETQRGLAADRQAPPERRLQAALNVLAADANRYEEVAKAVADVEGIEASPFFEQFCAIAFEKTSRSEKPEPLLRVMVAFRANRRALAAFADRSGQVEESALAAHKIVQAWRSPDRLERDAVLAPAELTAAGRFIDLLLKEIAVRLLSSPAAEEDAVCLACLTGLQPDPGSLAHAFLEVAQEHRRTLTKDFEKQVEAERQRLQDERIALRSQYQRDLEQQILDLLPAASSLWLLRQELVPARAVQVTEEGGSDIAKEGGARRLDEVWAFLLEALEGRGYRPFPESQPVPFDASQHEFQGGGLPPAEGAPVRVVRLGLEKTGVGGWRRARKAIVV